MEARAVALAAIALVAAGCGRGEPSGAPEEREATFGLRVVATSDRQWTGVAVAPDGRVFVSYPRWSPEVPFSVGLLVEGGRAVPYPGIEINRWGADLDPGSHLVCVQSVVVDELGRLWILDPASPMLGGVVAGGAKLIEVDPALDQVARTYLFGPDVAPPDSYLNDVRIDVARRLAYLTDSGSGALVVLDLETGEARRVLDRHPSTHSEDVVLEIGGRPWLRPDGSRPQVHADGIALSPDHRWVYYQALTGRTLYRVPTAALADPSLGPDELGLAVEAVGRTGAADGLAFSSRGDLYLTSLEMNAIRRLTPTGEVRVVAQDDRIAWPDSLAITPGGRILFTTSEIHLSPDPPAPYRLFEIVAQP